METEVKIIVTRGNETTEYVKKVEDDESLIGRVDNIFIKLQRIDNVKELADSYEVDSEADNSPDGA